jgi:predicted transglutaminase-like cysteine proteinase
MFHHKPMKAHPAQLRSSAKLPVAPVPAGSSATSAIGAAARTVAGIAALTGVCLASPAQAFISLPRVLGAHMERIAYDVAVLPPVAHSRFCLQYPADCEIRGTFRQRGISLTQERWAELAAVNRAVNRAIAPQRNLGGVKTEQWLVSPKAGDCNDYAVTKRHELLAHGWPSRALILSEVATTSGEHHLVLVIRAQEGDFVLDNLNHEIQPMAATRYQWVRAQSPDNPKFWSTVHLAAP